MVPKIHAKGSSFKGAAAYLLHDKDRADTAERVVWVETINLATKNPETAWRVMAATAMDAARLKEQAGVKKTGRQSKDSVLHVSLAWSPDQSPGRADMTDFAYRALAALKAEDRQAMIICHSDEKHPHVHLLINRVSPTDGRLLSSSKEKAALAALALAYEKEGGTIYCKQREANAESREQGEFVRGEKDIPRDEIEALHEAQDEAEAAIPARLIEQQPEAVQTLRRSLKEQLRQRLAEARQMFRPQWAATYGRHRTEKQNGRQEGKSFVDRLTGWLDGQTAGSGPSLPFLRQNLKGVAGYARGQAKRQQTERADLGQAQRQYFRGIVAELKQDYGRALDRIFHRRDTPAANQGSGAGARDEKTLSAIQQRAAELSRPPARREPSPATETARDRDRDRDFEP
jgi:hypothetical protein